MEITERRIITTDQLTVFRGYLREEEWEQGTIEKHLRDIQTFAVWAGGREVNKELTASWEDHLRVQGLRPEKAIRDRPLSKMGAGAMI